MTFEETTKTHQGTTTHTREDTSSFETGPSEQSLLSLIEERRADLESRIPARRADFKGRLPIGRVDDANEDDRPGQDHLMIRLGGNGF